MSQNSDKTQIEQPKKLTEKEVKALKAKKEKAVSDRQVITK